MHERFAFNRILCPLVALTLCTVAASAPAQNRPGAASPLLDGKVLTDHRHHWHDDDGGIAGGTLGPQGAGNHIIAQQCGSGGWSWPHAGDPGYSCAPGSQFNNITAPICEGLLQGFAATGDPDFLGAAVAGANFDLTGVYLSGDTRFGAFTPAFFHRISAVTGNPVWATNAETDFFDKLTAGTYGDPSSGGTWSFPGDTDDWINRLQELRSGGLINLRPWDLHQLPWVAGQLGNPGQQDAFRDAVLDGLNTLDAVNPGVNPAYYGEIIGLAGGVRGLALNGTTTFPAINAPAYALINGDATLCQLADDLASLQQANGSWLWTSNGAPLIDEDTQTTAYAVLALIAAQEAGCGPYTTEIADGRAYLATMQDVDGGYFSYPMGDHNIETESEALWARSVPTEVNLNAPSCNTGGTIIVSIDKSETTVEVVGGQFFLSYDTTKLSNPVVAVGDAPFVQLIDSDTSVPGEVFVATGVNVLVDPTGTTDAATMARVTFTVVSETCGEADLVEFRTHTPPTRLTDADANETLPVLSDLPTIVIDQTDPTFTCPPNIIANTDAGSCLSASVLPAAQTFDTPPTLSATQVPGAWYVDRYAPCGFTSAVFDGSNRLKHSICAADCTECRPSGFNSAFYDTQGRKYDIRGAKSMTVDLDVPASWATTGRRMAGFWGVGLNATGGLSESYPIIEFTSTSDDSGVPRFRVWDNAWLDIGLPTGFTYDRWYTLNIELVGTNWVYTVGDLMHTVSAIDVGGATVEIGSVILQGHNTASPGVTYDIYWDNFASTSVAATDNCDSDVTVVGVRSDAAALDAPYPQGNTLITWTATDNCGNFNQCVQTVTVNANNTAVATVELKNVTAPMTRCITFEFFLGGIFQDSVSAEVAFNDTTSSPGSIRGTATFDVACGAYDCITVRDQLHTLRRTVNTASEFQIVGTQYMAEVTSSGSNDDSLVGGNANDDAYIDILDFGAFAGQFNTDPAPPGGSTFCPPGALDADFSGNGVVFIEDYTFVANNFLLAREASCGGSALAGGGDDAGNGPITRISVRELSHLGMSHLARADFNHDGWLDTLDMECFLNGGSLHNSVR